MASVDPASVVRAESVSKRYGAGAGATEAVRSVSLEVAAGEFVALMGPSGCGKTTLLNLLGAMDRPTAGTVWLNGRNTSQLNDIQLTMLRREQVGFVFQAFHLLPTLTVAENIQMQLLLRRDLKDREARVVALAARVGLEAKLNAFPGELSGGEMQRAAVARALIHRPKLIIADEPTGNLDSQSAARVLDLLSELSREAGAAVIMATHSQEAAAYASRLVRMRDGRVE